MARELEEERLSVSEVAARAGVTPATLKRWVEKGVIPDGKRVTGDGWTQAAAAHARVVARLRERGHSLDEIKEAAAAGRRAFGGRADLSPARARGFTLDEAAEETG